MKSLPLLQHTERWIAYVRAGAVFFAVLQIVLETEYPPGYEQKAWLVTAVFALGAAVLVVLARATLDRGSSSCSPSSRSPSTRDRVGLSARLQLRAREPDPPGLLPRGHRGGGSLRDRRRIADDAR